MPGLYLSELTLSHFRSHKSGRLSLDARPVAIHGPNGAGKTNLIEAISLLSPGRGLRRAAAQDMARRPEALGWKITAILNSLHQVHEVETFAEGTAARQVRIDSKTATQLALGRIARLLWLVPAMDRLWIEGADGRRRFLDRMTMSFIPAHAEVTLAYDKAMRERNRLLKDQVRDAQWYLALERQMADAGAEIHANRQHALALIMGAQMQAETAFPTAELELTQTEGEMPDSADDLRQALAESRFRDLMAGRTLIGPHRADLYGVYAAKGVPAADCSTGEQKALLVSLILANARALARDFGAPPLLLLDEVAAHLDATRRAALYDEICALGAQAWMTGTGPELFSELGNRAQHIHVTDTSGISQITPEAP
ncbi:DNA replication and repair protein RecF [Roseovarius sp. EC-HK134]|uniref:DNA replication/repair protein RecF n=1 Tax=Roseovarius TaxID=74030 RepID=UPI00125169E7|nr:MULTISPECIES: DNA replication/repair protein RecF [unclassified Roseovarius]VVT11702.1 DNA replication and repair protein RecF [Roseovarius sp. EC-HK134]VVT11851.1 DNA replication and repair protein RecF [Roseovarius sp. EC-SD190]